MVKIQNLNFTILAQTLYGSMHDVLEWIWRLLPDEMSFEFFTPIWPRANEN